MKRLGMLIFCIMCVLLVFVNNSSAFDRKTLIGKKLFTRTNLKVKGSTVFFHNMSSLKEFIPVGTAVVITGAGGKVIKFKTVDIGYTGFAGKKYNITDRPSVYEKYFVADKNEIDFKAMSRKAREAIKTMSVHSGMTKNEIFVSKGCPAYISSGVKSWGASLEKVMSSDKWYYNLDTRRRDLIVDFTNGVVTKIVDRTGLVRTEIR